jgi:hypothetical protein
MKINRIVSCGLVLGLGGCLTGCDLMPSGLKLGGASRSISTTDRLSSSRANPDDSSGLHRSVLTLTKLEGTVLDAQTGQPVPNAVVYHHGAVWSCNPQGHFSISRPDTQEPILIKASGYKQLAERIIDQKELRIQLTPFQAKGLYLTHFGVSSKVLRDGVLSIIKQGNLNALVLDVKGDRGYLSYKLPVPLAAEIGAHQIPTIKDLKALIEQLHEQKIYVIGRIVIFKDNLLSMAHPEWAVVDSRTGNPWKDHEGLGWVDPFQKKGWEYNLALAKAAAQMGFDEIQFDYVRFPAGGDRSAIRFSQDNTRENREAAINAFLESAYQELLPYNVYFSADIFGYVPWNYNDTDIGQSITEVARHLDYICLMVYPSGYHMGIPGYRSPVAHPREIVYLTLEQAKKRLHGQAEKLRPWLQNFKDYAFDRRVFGESQIQLQIKACEEAGSSGWLLWDPTNKYEHTLNALLAVPPPSETAKKMTAQSGAFTFPEAAPGSDPLNAR